MPEKRHTTEERSRILNVYLRPWVLRECDVATHVPHLTELNTVRDWNAITRNPSRKRCKTTPVLPQRCSYREAWKEYLRGHIVSQHAAGIISNFLATTCCYSSQGLFTASWSPVQKQSVFTASWSHMQKHFVFTAS